MRTISLTTRIRLVLSLLAFALPALASAQPRLEWLVPERLQPGEALLGLTSIDADGRARLPAGAKVDSSQPLAELEPSGAVRRFQLRATRGRLALAARLEGAREARLQVEVGAPAARVSLTATPARPVKGRDEAAELRIAVLRGDGTPDPDAPAPVVRCNVGQVVDVRPSGGGSFSARYLLPRERFPEVAIVVAFAPWPHEASDDGAFGALAIPLASAVALPGRTESRATISVEIAGASFGPVRAGDDGQFELPVVVPPGHRIATSVTKDRAGNRRKKQIDLKLPATDRIACVANPTTLPADGSARARVLCVATDPFGAPVEGARLAAGAPAGALAGPHPLGAGVYEWEYRAPAQAAGSSIGLDFDFPAGGAQSREHIEMALVPPPVAAARVSVEPAPIFLGAKGRVTVEALDETGNPVLARPRLTASAGTLGPFAPAGPGRFVADYRAPAEFPGRWQAEISGPVLPGVEGAAARLVAKAEGAGIAVRAEGWGGAPVAGLALELGGAGAVTGADGVARLPVPGSDDGFAHLVIRAAERPSLRAELWRLPGDQGTRWFPQAESAPLLGVAATVVLAPATPADVRLELIRGDGGAPALRFAILDPDGVPLRGREAVWRLARADGTAVQTGAALEAEDGNTVVPILGPVDGALSASVVDVASGVSAAMEASLP